MSGKMTMTVSRSQGLYFYIQQSKIKRNSMNIRAEQFNLILLKSKYGQAEHPNRRSWKNQKRILQKY